MSDITIVTAFFDIGRGNWTSDKGLPNYLQRTTETYMERFRHLCKLDNNLVVFTSKDLTSKISDIILSTKKAGYSNIVNIDFHSKFQDLREKISNVQNSNDFISKINPSQVKNPEYWNVDYVLVNLLKSVFVNNAIKMDFVSTDLVAWIDFGYCRSESTLNGKSSWKFPFDKEKIHFFNIKDWNSNSNIQNVISNNDVHITGPCIVASKQNWPNLESLIFENLNLLLNNNLIDDDQTLLLMSYLSKPELFDLHKVSNSDWFIIFKDYNESLS